MQSPFLERQRAGTSLHVHWREREEREAANSMNRGFIMYIYITLITYKLITITQKYSIFNISHGSGNRTGAPIERLQPHL